MPTQIPFIRRVLVPCALSRPQDPAVAYGCALVQPGGVVRLLHVNEPHDEELYDPTVSEQDLDASQPTHLETIVELKKQLRLLAAAVPDEKAFTIEVSVIEGDDEADVICEQADQMEADVICLATRNRRGLAASLLGSVAEQVIENAARPVLVVPISPPKDKADRR